MLRPRVIPVLTLEGRSMVKTMRFADPVYLGDPVNALRIFNTKEVDELIIVDITATAEGRAPDLSYVRELASECFMPICFGGGITTTEQAEQVLKTGVEKVSINTAALEDVALVTRAAKAFGSQSVVVSLDVKRRRRGYRVANTGRKVSLTDREPVAWARELEDAGAGELLLTSVDREGTAEGYDEELIAAVTHAVSIPVIACGGAGSKADLRTALASGASAAAAGRLFVTHGRHRAALISYPTPEEIEALAE